MKRFIPIFAVLAAVLLTSTASATGPFIQGVRAFRAARAAAILNQQAFRVQPIVVQKVQRVQVVQKVQAVQVQPAYVQQFVSPAYSYVAPVQAYVAPVQVQAIQVQKVQAVQAHGCAAFFSSGY